MQETSPLGFPITICGLSELCGHAACGVTHVVTILDPEWPDPRDFQAYDPHHRTVWRFHDTIREAATDMIPPSPDDVGAVLEYGRRLKTDAVGRLLIHCHMGISRSTATAITLMVQDQPGRERDAFAYLRTIRPQSWPNSRMIAFADHQLGRGGALSAALVEHQKLVAAAEPDFAQLLRQSERAGEVPPAG